MGEFADAGVGYCLREPATAGGIRVVGMGRQGKGGERSFIPRNQPGRRSCAAARMTNKALGILQEIRGHFGHYDFHDAFAVAGAGNAAGFGVRVAAAADERGIADASGKFAAGAAGGSASDEMSVPIESDGADRAGFVADVMFGGV